MSRHLGISRTTTTRKFRFLADQCRLAQKDFLERFRKAPVDEIYFDEMEAFEHTKLKPLSIPLAVNANRHILSLKVASMPAKGLLAKVSRKKYGPRKDERRRFIRELFRELKLLTREPLTLHSDQNPHYPPIVRHFFPGATHHTTPGGRGAVVGQGELKKLKWDPLFRLNHTAAMLRANMNRLFRRTWCTTKTIRGLRDHLAVYAHYHNTELVKA